MRKAVVALLAVGAVLGVGFVARRMSRKMQAHMAEMAARCKEMTAGRNGGAEVPGEREVEEMKKQEAPAPSA